MPYSLAEFDALKGVDGLEELIVQGNPFITIGDYGYVDLLRVTLTSLETVDFVDVDAHPLVRLVSHHTTPHSIPRN